MKNILLSILIAISAMSAFGQNKQAADSAATLNGLPVLRSYVAPEVVERAKKKFGRALYSIEKSTAANCQNSYLVGLIRNGRLSIEWMCDDPKMVFRFIQKTALVQGQDKVALLRFAKQQVVLDRKKIFFLVEHKTVC